MCGHCKAEDAATCELCGVLVAFVYQPEHRTFHGKLDVLAARLVALERRSNEEQA